MGGRAVLEQKYKFNVNEGTRRLVPAPAAHPLLLTPNQAAFGGALLPPKTPLPPARTLGQGKVSDMPARTGYWPPRGGPWSPQDAS